VNEKKNNIFLFLKLVQNVEHCALVFFSDVLNSKQGTKALENVILKKCVHSTFSSHIEES
jgi:hypothetical protein